MDMVKKAAKIAEDRDYLFNSVEPILAHNTRVHVLSNTSSGGVCGSINLVLKLLTTLVIVPALAQISLENSQGISAAANDGFLGRDNGTDDLIW